MTGNFIPISRPSIGELEEKFVMDAVRSGWVSSIGRYIEEFEASFARYCGTEYAITVSNGTTGLHLAFAALGLGPGDEVIIPDLTFVATANAVAYTGAKPVLADIDPETSLYRSGIGRIVDHDENQGDRPGSSLWTSCGHGCARRSRGGS